MSKPLIVVITSQNDFYPDQIKRLKSLGRAEFYLATTSDEWLKRCKNADIICSGKRGLKEKIYELRDVFVSLPFVAVDWLDRQKLQERNITVARSPGCNREAVAEWILGMMINLVRSFPDTIKTTSPPARVLVRGQSLKGKSVCILGKGNVGSRVGELCAAFRMNVRYFSRGDDVYASVRDADIVVDCLSSNPSTENLLGRKFFRSVKKGSYFITVTGPKICDIDALIDALDRGILAGAAHDAAGIQVGDTKDPFYRKLLKHPKILVTPHIAYNSDVAARCCNDTMIKNVESWLKGKPVNLLE